MAGNDLMIPFEDLTRDIVSQYYEDDDVDGSLESLAGGIGASFAIVSIRGKHWRVKYQGEENLIPDKDGEPVRKLRCVIVGANPALSKTFYAGSYESGADSPPDCASINGIVPDPGVPHPQSDYCASCENNQLGSRVTDAGVKLKACADSKRLAIVPANDVKNEAMGGAMLLRVPPASLASLRTFYGTLKKHGVPLYGVVTEIGFDPDAEYPKLVFKPVAFIQSESHRNAIREVRNDTSTSLVTDGASGDMLALPAARPAAEPKSIEKPKPATKKADKPKPKPEPVEEAQEVDEDQTESDEDQVEADEDQTEGGEEQEEVAAKPASKPAAAKKSTAKTNGTSKPKTLDAEAETQLGSLLDGL